MKNILVSGLFVALCGLPAAAEEVKIDLDGLTLNANLTIADGTTLADGVVLMVHGTFAHKDMEIMSAIQDGLNERGHSSLNINLSYATNDRHGMFGCENAQTFLDTDAMHEIGVWSDWLRDQGAGDIILFGHSRGGNVMARYAALGEDDNLAGAILAAPAASGSVNSAESYAQRHGTELEPILQKAQELVDAGQGGTLMEGIGFSFCAETDVSADVFLDNYGEQPDRHTPSVLPRVDLPVLVAVGTADDVVPGLAPAMRALDLQNVTFVEIEDGDHFFLDFFAEDLLDAMEEFLADHGL